MFNLYCHINELKNLKDVKITQEVSEELSSDENTSFCMLDPETIQREGTKSHNN